MSGSTYEHLMLDLEPQQFLKHVCTPSVIHVPSAVADCFGRIFVTRTLPCVRFIVYRPDKLSSNSIQQTNWDIQSDNIPLASVEISLG